MRHLPKKIIFLSSLVLMLAGCGSSPKTEAASVQGISVDTAVQQAARNIENNIEAGQKAVVLNFSSSSVDFSEYVLGELSTELVNGRKLQVVDRRNLEAIRAEMDFQISGEVSDESAQAIGRKLGAEYIISGSLTNTGGIYRFRINTINVESAGIAASSATDIVNDGKVQALLASREGATGTQTAQRVNAGGNTAESVALVTPTAQAPVQPTIPAPPPTPVYKIGDTGPAGGLIFYDKGNSSNGWRYLEAAPAETEKKAIFHLADERGYSLSGLITEQGIGMGKKITETILRLVASRGEWDRAAQVCDELNTNGFDDWFLPSYLELSLMYGNLHRKGLGGFQDVSYYCSTIGKNGAYNAPIVIYFADGSNRAVYANNGNSVRAVRQF
jgi:TolB-like protein